MESLFLLAFGEEEFLAALGMTGSETFFNKLLEEVLSDQLIRWCCIDRLSWQNLSGPIAEGLKVRRNMR